MKPWTIRHPERGEGSVRTAAAFVILLVLALVAGCGDRPVGQRTRDIQQAIKEFSSDSGPDRKHAAARLERLLPSAKQAAGIELDAIKRLRVLVTDDRDDHVRAAAIRTLGKTADEQSWDIISKRLTSEETQVRIEVFVALCSIDSGRAFPLLVQALSDSELAVRMIGAATLATTDTGVKELVRRLENGDTDKAVLVSGLESSSLPAAMQVVLNGLSSANPLLRSAAIRKAGAMRHKPAVPALEAFLDRDKKAGISEDDRHAAAQSLAAIGGEEAMLSLLMHAHAGQKWLNELLAEHRAQLRPVLIAQANSESRRVPVETLARFLLPEFSPECVAALAAIAGPDLPDLVKVCQSLRTRAPAELRAKVAARLRTACAQMPRSSLSPRNMRAAGIVTGLSLVGEAGDGPDATAACELLRAVWNNIKASATSQPTTSRSERGEDPVTSLAEACGRLRAIGAAPMFIEMMRTEQQNLLIAGLAGAVALGDAACLDQANQTMLSGKVHPWPLMQTAFPTLAMDCHDPRILPGLVAMKSQAEAKSIYRIIAANGTPQAVAILMADLADPAIGMDKKRDYIAPVMAGLGDVGRPAFIKAMVESPRPAKAGDPDVGWWSAEFLREQRDAAAADVLKALAARRPSGWIAARFIRALDLADTPEAIAAQASWLNDSDRDLVNLALQSLVRNRRTTAIAAIRAARDATTDQAWRERLGLAIDEISKPVEKGST